MVSALFHANITVWFTLAIGILLVFSTYRERRSFAIHMSVALVLFSVGLLLVNTIYEAYLNWAGPTVDQNAAVATAVCHPTVHFGFTCYAREAVEGYEIVLIGDPNLEMEEAILDRIRDLKPIITPERIVVVFKTVERRRIVKGEEAGTSSVIDIKTREDIYRVENL